MRRQTIAGLMVAVAVVAGVLAMARPWLRPGPAPRRKLVFIIDAVRVLHIDEPALAQQDDPAPGIPGGVVGDRVGSGRSVLGTVRPGAGGVPGLAVGRRRCGGFGLQLGPPPLARRRHPPASSPGSGANVPAPPDNRFHLRVLGEGKRIPQRSHRGR
jgi:hypothetical protein